jgi:START domain-containing protein
VTTTSITDEGPPPSSRFVRVVTSAGHWHAEPAAGGGTDVTYTIRTDVGGRLPAWIVNRAQRETVPDVVRAMLTRARTTTPP